MTPDLDHEFLSACATLEFYDDHIDALVAIIRATEPTPEELDGILVMLWHKIEERVIGGMRQ